MNEDIQTLDTGLDAVPGFYVQGVHCGIKKVNNDLAVIYSPDPATAAAVFTTNRVLAAPVTLTREHLEKRGQFQMVVVNSGVANACTGQRGREDAQKMVEVATREFDLSSTELVAVASTGVIGDFLPLDKIEKGIQMVRALYPKDSSGKETARAIMTTDTFMKEAAVALSVGGKTVHIAGIAKGSGMIRPHMATMLGFLLTDATVKREALQSILREAVDLSFNRVTVDGDTSTNDMVLLLANGKSGTPLLDEFHPDFPRFRKALIQV
ncbi:MAG: bifunctional ornithine acetyltransferase/N-acetylglutamate synthase, partial [Atribacterota bacterium]